MGYYLAPSERDNGRVVSEHFMMLTLQTSWNTFKRDELGLERIQNRIP